MENKFGTNIQEEGDIEDEQQYDLISNIKYCNKDKQISIPMQVRQEMDLH